MLFHRLILSNYNTIDAFIEASPMFATMAPIIFLLLLLSLLFSHAFSLVAQSTSTRSRITVVGVVYCDTCSTNSFSKHSYFLTGVDVHLQCTFKANSPKTSEQINFSVNRTTDRYGIYKLEVPHIDGVDCVDGMAIQSLCQASLIGSSSPACDVPGLKTTTNEVSVKSRQDNLCIYSVDALSFRPAKRNNTLCGDHKQDSPTSFNSSKFFLPYYPPYSFPWPPLPQLPPLPSLPFPPLPPLPSFPFPFPPLPPYPTLPFPPSPPSLPFPFPHLPPFPPTPSLFHPPPPPPPAFNLGDPRTWIPNIPLLSPPPPPAFNLRDPRTWIPFLPPSPPSSQNQNP